MSIHITNRVLLCDEQRLLLPSEKFVLFLLADSANAAGLCWPSTATISRYSNLNERTIRRAIDRLVQLGHVTIKQRPGRSSYYTIHPDGPEPGPRTPGNTPGVDERDDSEARAAENEAGEPPQSNALRSSRTASDKRSESPPAIDPAVESCATPGITPGVCTTCEDGVQPALATAGTPGATPGHPGHQTLPTPGITPGHPGHYAPQNRKEPSIEPSLNLGAVDKKDPERHRAEELERIDRALHARAAR